jgi:hypothetical protein
MSISAREKATHFEDPFSDETCNQVASHPSETRRFGSSNADAFRTSDCEIPNYRAIREGMQFAPPFKVGGPNGRRSFAVLPREGPLAQNRSAMSE